MILLLLTSRGYRFINLRPAARSVYSIISVGLNCIINCVELVKVTTKLLFLQISWLVGVSPAFAPGSNRLCWCGKMRAR